MKPVLKTIAISLTLAVLAVLAMACSLFQPIVYPSFNTMMWYWLGILLAYLSLIILVFKYPKTFYYTRFHKVLIKAVVISLILAVLGIVSGILFQYIGYIDSNMMVWYWLGILLLYIFTVISLIVLVLINGKTPFYKTPHKILILLNIVLTLVPVLWTIFINILGHAMSSNAGV